MAVVVLQREWEAEVMVRAAAWILIWRGAGFAIGGLLGIFPRTLVAASTPVSWWFGVLFSTMLTVTGLALLCRERSVRWLALAIAAGGCYLAASPVLAFLHLPATGPGVFGLQGPLVDGLRPAFFLPDAYAIYCLSRRDARNVLETGRPPLPPLATAWRVRATGRVVVALGMTSLAILSSAVCLVFLPGVMMA